MYTLLRALCLLALLASPSWAKEEFSEITTLQNAATATGNGTVLSTEGYNAVVVSLTVTSATVTWEMGGAGADFVAIPCFKVGSNASATTANATGLYICNTAGMTGFRARISTYGSGTVTVAAQRTTAYAGQSSGFLFDSSGNLMTNLGTLLSCEDQTNNLCMTSGGVARGTEGNLINSAVGDATSAAFTLPTGYKTITGRITGAGAVAQVITIYGGTSSGMAAATSDVVCTITLSGTSGGAGTAASCNPFIAPFLYYIAVTSGSSGTPTTILTASY